MLNSTPQFVFITGVSSGIGQATARHLMAAGYHVIGSVRRQADAADLTASPSGEGYFTPVLLDVTDRESVGRLRHTIEALLPPGQSLYAIVNNAGLVVGGPMKYLTEDELRAQMEVNFFAVVAVTQQLLPLLAAGSRVINVSSTSGIITVPLLAPYSASKFALEALTLAWRGEMLPQQIYFVLLNPGPIQTPIWNKTNRSLENKYADTEYAAGVARTVDISKRLARRGYPPEKVAATIARILRARRPKHRYWVVKRRFFYVGIPRFTPRAILDRVLIRVLKLRT